MSVWFISHDDAIDLAADRIDFGISPAEERALEEHLEACADCAINAQTLLDDDKVLDAFEWIDDPDGPYRRPRTEDDDDSDDRESDGERPFGADGADVHPDDGDGGKGHSSPPPPVALGDDDDADDDEKDDASLSAEDEAEADAMSDEDLSDVDSEARPEDGILHDCVGHGVEDAAAANGAPTGERQHQHAEQAVRDAEGLEVTDYGTVAVYRSTHGLHGGRGNETPQASPAAAAAIRNAILRSRTGTTGIERHQKHGRLDGKALHRVAQGDRDIFRRQNAPDPGRFLVWVLVDVSGSMAGQTVADAAAVARALADASSGTPSVRLVVWAWSNPFLANGRAHAGVARVWETGEPTSNVFNLTKLHMGGTPDAPVLDWAWKAILKAKRSDESPVVIMCSDGWGYGNLHVVVENATKHGVAVKSVAMGYGVQEDMQIQRFGRGNYAPWMGSMEETARPLATMIAKMAAGK